MANLTIITVTWNTWSTWTSRLIEQVFHYVDPDDYTRWIVVDNNSADGDEISDRMSSFPVAHRDRFQLVCSDINIGDIPQYNRIIPAVTTKKVVCISTDMRIFAETIPYFLQALDHFTMVGHGGPFLMKGQEDPKLGGNWHWVPQLLVERNLAFDDTRHIQTHCFGILKSPFLEVGRFWENPDVLDPTQKGDYIAGELSLGVKLRKAGYTLGTCRPPMVHYGNDWISRETIDAFDKRLGWESFPKLF